MKDFSTPTCTTRSASSQKNLAVIDSECYDAISKTVSYVLNTNASSYITKDDIKDVTQAAATRVLLKSSMYDPEKNTAFKTWATTVAHNYAIQLSKKIKETADMSVAISGLLDMADSFGDDDELKTVSKAFKGKDSSTSWAKDNLGINAEESNADFTFTKEAEESAMNKRVGRLQDFLDTKLNSSEKLLFEMMRSGLSKTEMMEKTGKTGGNIDTSICRLRSKVHNWMKASDYYGIE